MESYRIKHWPDPNPRLAGLASRRALAAMSVGWVTRPSLQQQTRLSRREIDSLLDLLESQSALQYSSVAPVLPSFSIGTVVKQLLRRVSQHIADAASVCHSCESGSRSSDYAEVWSAFVQSRTEESDTVALEIHRFAPGPLTSV